MARTMLKPDSTRYSSLTPTRVSGPEWIEPPPQVASPESINLAAFRIQEDFPSDSALDSCLREILQQARLTTAASGAVIAFARDGKMVCRATLGDKAPSVGTCLNTRSGLSGTCIQTREMQLCDDTLADPRVNAIACRDLGIRSIVVLPVLDGRDLWGVLELFSSTPRAFSDSDLQALQSLGRKISQKVYEEIASGSTLLLPEVFNPPPSIDPTELDPGIAEIPVEPEAQAAATMRRDYRTGALTAFVLALALLLGWMVGRVGWTMAVNRAPIQLSLASQDAPAPVASTHPSESVREDGPVPSPPVASSPGQPAVSKAAPQPAVAKPQATNSREAKSKTEISGPVGGLVIYEHGKVVFRMAPTESASKAASGVEEADPIQKAATKQEDAEAVPSSPAVVPAHSYLLRRVEPEYPESARQQHIQGPVVLSALVGSDGSVRELQVISGDALLVKAATDAVRQWRFQPHQLNGRAVEFETQITVNFALP